MDKLLNKFNIIQKANEKLINKFDELKDFINSDKSSMNMNEKEINKYYNLKNNVKAQAFKQELISKQEKFCEKINYDVETLNLDSVKNVFNSLIDYFAKVEDVYYDILNEVNSGSVNANSLFKIEEKINYYQGNLKFINSLEDKFTLNLKNLKEEELSL